VRSHEIRASAMDAPCPKLGVEDLDHGEGKNE